MVPAVALLCLVAGLLEGAFSLNCYHCSASGFDCVGNEKPCEKASDVCLSTITEVTTQGKAPSKSVMRSCGNKDMCNVTYSISMNVTTLYATIRCCDKDKCAQSNPEVLKNAAKNDHECDTCNDLKDKCQNPVKIKCTGDEKKCAKYTSKDSKSTYTSQVCVTENLCKLSNITVLPYDQVLMSEIDCKDHAPSLLPGLSFPVALVIAMLKLLS